jgi:pimeloyl-ACP methyl ester carboxylesterase
VEDRPVDLNYEEIGEGTPMVLVHGFPLDHTIWEPLIPHLRADARLIMPDLRGHGKSAAPEGAYSMRQMADDILALIDRLKLNRVVLVGHSMGGYIGLAFARAYPQRLAGLGFIATHAAADGLEQRQTRLKMANKVRRKGVDFVAADMAPKLTGHPGLAEHLHELIKGASPNGVIGALKGMADRPDSTEFLSEIQVPAVVVYGADDGIIPLERAQVMAQLLPRGWLVEISGTKHMPMMEKPEEVAAALRELVQAAEKFKQ